jgi:ATP citrate (pro-S)-lyase
MAKAESAKKTSASELFDRNTQSFIYNNQVMATQRMLDFDYASGREIPSVAAIINSTGSDSFAKFFFGKRDDKLCILQVGSALN